MVAPDYATVAATIASSRASKAEAVRATATALDRLTTDLAAHGGVTLEADTERHPLTWSAHSATTHAERAYDDRTGRHEPTGQVTAEVAVMVTVRAFELLDPLGAAAIQAAIRKGRDYAAALGSSLRSVEHLADAGLLGGNDAQPRFAGAVGFARAPSRGGEESDAPSLDPVPQELTAIVEARLTADGVSLTAGGLQVPRQVEIIGELPKP